MIFVVGGCFQGKREYGLSLLKPAATEDEIADGENCTWQEAMDRPVLDHFHALVKRLLVAEENETNHDAATSAEAGSSNATRPSLGKAPRAAELPERMGQLAAGKRLILTDEIGNGIVPMDPLERRFRELAGRLGCRLAGEACEVHKVVCGVGYRIK